MAQVAPSQEPPGTPPPIPLRSPLRNDSTSQPKLYTIKSSTGNTADTPLPAALQVLPEGVDCKSANTQQRIHDTVSQAMNNKRGSALTEDCKSPSLRSPNRRSHSRGEECGSSELCRSEARVGAGLPEGLQQQPHLIPLIPHLVVSCEQDQKGLEHHSKIDGEVVGVSTNTATQPERCNTATSTVTKTGLGLTSHSLQSSQYQRKSTDTKVCEWLRHGLLDSPPPEPSFPARNSKSSDCSFASRHVPLSPFPPKSSSTDFREYMPRIGSSMRSVCPVSPLNNGRDAYGNHIPLNARDYFTAHSQPSLLKPLTINDEKSLLCEKPLTVGRPNDCRWNKFKSFWKAAGTRASNQQTEPRYPHIILDTDNIPRDVPGIMYPGRVGERSLQSIHSSFPVAYSRLDSPVNAVKGNYSIPDLRRGRVQDACSSLEGPELVVPGETSRSKNRFNVTYSPESTSRREKIRHNEKLTSPKRSVQVERNENDMSNHWMDGTIINPIKDKSSNACRKVEHERKRSPTEKRKQPCGEVNCNKEEQLTCQQAREQDQSAVCEDAHRAATTPPQAKRSSTLERMLDFGIQIPRKSTSSSRNFPRQDFVPALVQDSHKQKQHQNAAMPKHVTPVPASASIMSSTAVKPQPLLRTMLSKAGNISRSIFTPNFGLELKASSQRQTSTDSSKTSPTKPSMSADRNDRLHSIPLHAQEEANTLAGHYQVLTAGAFGPPSNHHNRHASLASITNEALLIADQLLQRDVRWSTDQARSNFSSGSTSEIVPLSQNVKKEKEEQRKKGEVARAMAWMGLYS